MKNIDKVLEQQKAIAEFGSFAFQEDDLTIILNRACKLCATLLGAEASKICHFEKAAKRLSVVAGYGWKVGVIGYHYALEDLASPQIRALETGQPVISDVHNSGDFLYPSFYQEHAIRSTVDVIIKGKQGAFGVLEVDSATAELFDKFDVIFLTSFANILAEAINSAKKSQRLKAAIKKRDTLLKEKNELIAQKALLAAEAHHRVRNNLQIIHGMLVRRIHTLEEGGVSAEDTLRKIASRVMAMGRVYDQLIVSDHDRFISASAYLTSLIKDIRDIYEPLHPHVHLDDSIAPIDLDIDQASVLGLIATELFANAFMHAFPKGRGTIVLRLKRNDNKVSATLSIADNGIGFDAAKASTRNGMKLIHRFVEQIGGTMEITTNEGSEFRVTFPLHRDGPTSHR
jgi:two-component sensor histidine kinase